MAQTAQNGQTAQTAAPGAQPVQGAAAAMGEAAAAAETVPGADPVLREGRAAASAPAINPAGEQARSARPAAPSAVSASFSVQAAAAAASAQVVAPQQDMQAQTAQPFMAPAAAARTAFNVASEIMLDSRPVSAELVGLRSEQAMRAESAPPAPQEARPAPRADAAAIVRLAQQIGQRAGAGARSFEIRMDPPELGRIDVRLHVDGDNRAHAVLLAERADTLSDLSRAARALERALEEAGLKLAQNGLEFGLKRDAPGQGGQQGSGPARDHERDENAARAAALTSPAAASPMGGDGDVMSYGFRLAHAPRLAMRV